MQKKILKTQDKTSQIFKYTIFLALFLVVISMYGYIDVLNMLARPSNESVQGVSDKNKGTDKMARPLDQKLRSNCRPVISKPAHRAIVDTTSAFGWSANCPQQEVVSYQLRITGAGIRPIMVNDIAATTYALSNVTGLKEGKKYVWTVGTCLKRKVEKQVTPASALLEKKAGSCVGVKWADPRAFYWMKKPTLPTGKIIPTEDILPSEITPATQ